MAVAVLVIATCVVAVALWYAISNLWPVWRRYKEMAKVSEQIPGLPRHWLLGNVHQVLCYIVWFRPRKKHVEFPLTRPTLFYGPDPTDFIDKFVYTELKGQYKIVKPLSGDCKNAGH